MFVFSESEPVSFKLGEGEDTRFYKIRKWSSFTSNIEGFKLAKILTPAWTVILDSLNRTQSLEDMGLEEQQYFITEAATMIQQTFEEEHYQDLCMKLLKSVIFEGEKLDTEEKLIKHFDKYPNDFYSVLFQSFKENLIDFFMQDDMFRNKIDSLKALVPSLAALKQKMQESNKSSD